MLTIEDRRVCALFEEMAATLSVATTAAAVTSTTERKASF